MIKIDVLVRDKNWKKCVPNPEKYLNQKAKQIRETVSTGDLVIVEGYDG